MELRASAPDAGKRLDAFLAEPLGSRSRAERLIAAGAVRVGGLAVPKRHRIAEGDVVTIEAAPETRSLEPEDPARSAAFIIAYEDAQLLVVDKPAGVVVHPARGHPDGTLAQALEGRAGGGEDRWRPGIVHRLDRETSGLLVVAKSDVVHAALKRALARRELTREYLALVDGRPSARNGTIDAPIGRDRHLRTRMSTDSDRAREAVTHFAIEQVLPRSTLLRVRLETGRTHQIRVHLQAIGHPVLGDPEYGPPHSGPELGLTRQFLHAARLAFPHPLTGVVVDVHSQLPADLAAALERAADAR